MRIANKYTILFMLCLALLSVANIHCLSQPITPPSTPQSTELPPQDTTPPQTIITNAPDKTIDYNEVTFQWTGSDNITSTANLTYSYYLQGYDIEYSPFNVDTTKTYIDLPNDTYTFYVKSRDEAGNVDPTPASVTFTIAIPQIEEKSEATTPALSTLLIVPDSDVSHIAVAYDNTVYALDSPHARLYKSDGGIGWTDISRGIGTAAPWTGLAVAPDDSEIVAVVTNAGTEVCLSTNGGTTFATTGLAGKLGGGERVRCLAISSDYGRRDISVGTSTGTGNGRLLTNVVNGYPSSWQDMSTGAAGWSNADIFALEYSPGFDADGTILAIAATAPPTDDTYLYIGTRDLGGNTITWNSFAGYPVEICQTGQDTPGTPLTYADLALPADYSGSRPSHRHIYACWSDMGGNPDNDVYRLDNAACYRLMVRDIICSLAHYGMFSQGKLLAGAAIASATDISTGPQVYCSFNPQSAYPSWQSSQKPPTGPGQARVAWSPDGKAAYCGTNSAFGSSHDQSAFSISRDDGFTWNQIGLIDL